MLAELALATTLAMTPVAIPNPPLIRSVQSGPWSDPMTREGGLLPGPGSRVQVREGHRVLYDRNSDQPIRSIHVASVLEFARDRDTRLDVGLIKVQAGDDDSENGFACDDHPVPAGRLCRSRLGPRFGL